LGGLNSDVFALAVSGSNVYAGGQFTTADGIAVSSVAKWDGHSWSPMGSGIGYSRYSSSAVTALGASGTNVYVGGWFAKAGGNAASRIAKWNETGWSALGAGMNGGVGVLATLGSNLYAGGSFTNADGNRANHVATWNGSGWTVLGLGLDADVYALARSGTNVFAAGEFMRATNSGGQAVTVNRIAKWDGSSWSALGSGINNTVYALAVSGGDVYAGGRFTAASGGTGNYIAKWNGTGWSALGSGIFNNWSAPVVNALAVSGSDVYVGGTFTTAGGVTVNCIAKWDGSAWSALGSGMDGGGYVPSVNALAVLGGDLYAGGVFTMAGGTAARGIARWNGSSWSALGSGLNFPFVHALALSGTDLFVGGSFSRAAGSTVNNIAKWNGSSWSALGSGMNGYVTALAVAGNDLFVGGNFTTAGGKLSGYIARAYLPTLPDLSLHASGSEVIVSWPSVNTDEFTLEQTDKLANSPTWVTNGANVTDDGTNKLLSIPATNKAQYFRLRRP
jgi:hypothetical protein